MAHYMTEWEKDHFSKLLAELQAATKACRADMHEPDEQDISAVVRGSYLDNAGVEGELIVHIFKGGVGAVQINLASLIALARLADLTQIEITK